jgi:Mn-dependent DtxR family transcriptional regulator
MESKLGQPSLPDRMLQLLEEGGIHSTAELARRLGITEGLVAAMAASLTHHGYLTPIETGCKTSCTGCWAAERCSGTQATAPTLALTPKGRQAARRPHG